MTKSSAITSMSVRAAAAGILERIRTDRPRVHCITNTVAQNFTANILLALDARPSMTVDPDEIEAFVEKSDAVVVNIGTIDAQRRQAIERVMPVCKRRALPWVLDPVLVEMVPARLDLALKLAAMRPTVLRANRDEATVLIGGDPTVELMTAFAARHQTIVAMSGRTDIVTDASRVTRVLNGHPLLRLVTASGCALSAVIAASLSTKLDPMLATTAALAIFGAAAEQAAEGAEGPGSFAVRLIDRLAAITPEMVSRRVRLE